MQISLRRPCFRFDRTTSLPLVAICLASALAANCGGAGGNGSAAGGAGGSVPGAAGAMGSGGEPGGSGGGSGTGGGPGSGGQAANTGGAVGTGGRGGSDLGGAPGTGGTGTAGTGGAGGMGTTGSAGRGGGTPGGRSGNAGGRTGTLRILPLGDSTTGSVCWRALLWQKLTQNGYTGRFDFVGSRNNDSGCGVPGYDRDNEGHPSVLVTNFVNDADDQVAGVQTPQTLLGAHPADVVLFHFATNDVWNNRPPTAILAAYSTVLAALRQANPAVTVLVAKLIPMAVTAATCAGCSCPSCPAGITTLNDMLVIWAAANSTATSAISTVDQWTGFNATAGADTADGVHPNASGSTKISNHWYDALVPLL